MVAAAEKAFLFAALCGAKELPRGDMRRKSLACSSFGKPHMYS